MSTEHQQYSIDNQSQAIGLYATAHQMKVVGSYAPGLLERLVPESVFPPLRTTIATLREYRR
jgi:hypothetical protein